MKKSKFKNYYKYIFFILLSMFLLITACKPAEKDDINYSNDYLEIKTSEYPNPFRIRGAVSDNKLIATSGDNLYILNDKMEITTTINKKNIGNMLITAEGSKLYTADLNNMGVITEWELSSDELIEIKKITDSSLTDKDYIYRIVNVNNSLYFIARNTETQEARLFKYNDEFQVLSEFTDVYNLYKDSGDILVIFRQTLDQDEYIFYDCKNEKVIKNITSDIPKTEMVFYLGNGKILYRDPYDNSIIRENLYTGENENIFYIDNENIFYSDIIELNNYYYVNAMNEPRIFRISAEGVTTVRNTEEEEEEIVIGDDYKSLDEFTLRIYCGADYGNAKNKEADKAYKRLYPNAKLEYIENGSVLGQLSTYEEKLTLKLQAKDSDFDIYFITNPSLYSKVLNSEAYMPVENEKINAMLGEMFKGIKEACTYNGKIFGVPQSFYIRALDVDDNLVKRYSINYDFKQKPIVFEDMEEFIKKYCRDYDGDGNTDVFFDNYYDYSEDFFFPQGINEMYGRYIDIYIDWLNKRGSFDKELFPKILDFTKYIYDKYNCLVNLSDNSDNVLFPINFRCFNMFSDDIVTYPFTFKNKELYQSMVEYICVNRYSKLKAEYIEDFLAMRIKRQYLKLSDNVFLYDDFDMYKKMAEDKKFDISNLDKNYNFYRRLVKNSVPDSNPKEVREEFYDYFRTIQLDYLKGSISADELCNGLNKKLDMIFNG